MRLVIAVCSVDYRGRLDAHLPEATRLIMVKADGCVAVHADGGAYKPLNWMNAPNRLVTEPGRWEVTNSRGEQLVITLHEVLADTSHDLGTDPGLVKDGVEAHLQALLARACDHIEPGLELVRREHQTGIGPVDLLCRAANGESVAVVLDDPAPPSSGGTAGPAGGPGDWVAVEVKRKAGLDAVEQLSRYLDFLNRHAHTTPCRGILVATAFAPQAVTVANSRGIKCVAVDYDELRGVADGELRLF